MLGPRKQDLSSEDHHTLLETDLDLFDTNLEKASDLEELFNHLKKQKVTAEAKRESCGTNNSAFLFKGAGSDLSLRRGQWWEQLDMGFFSTALLYKQDLSCPESRKEFYGMHTFTQLTPQGDDQNMQMYTLMIVALLGE